MSWKWIPSQIQAVYGAPLANWQTIAGNPGQFSPGYFKGEGAEEGKYIVRTYPIGRRYANPYQSGNSWMICDNPTLQFQISAFNEDGDILWSGYASQNADGYESPTSRTSYSQESVGCFVAANYGKPVWIGGSAGAGDGNSFTLYYSRTQDTYIIKQGIYEDIILEPQWSTDQLCGVTVGDTFYRCGYKDFNIDVGWDQYEATFNDVLFEADGNLTDLSDSTFAHHLKMKPYFNHWIYSSDSETSAYESPPAGAYTNPDDGSVIYVGLQTYKGSDNSVWRGRKLASRSTGTSGSHYDADDGRKMYFSKNLTLKRYNFGRGAYCYNGSNSKIWFCGMDSTAESLSALPNTFTMSYYVYDTDLSTYQTSADYNIQMQKGPYDAISSDTTVLMGEVAMWR